MKNDKIRLNSWTEAQKWEKKWWNSCTNTYFEEMKQLLYADRMGLIKAPDAKTPYRFDMQGKSVLDIGGGPISLLLKCVNVRGKVIDSLEFPQWVIERYKCAGIEFERIKAEDLDTREKFDECLCYNVLPHADKPAMIIERMRKIGKIIRLFEWIDTAPSEGHPHSLNKKQLNGWLGGEGKIEMFTGQSGGRGKGYYGIFLGRDEC